MSKPVDWLSKEAVDGYVDSIWSENDRGVIILQGSTMELLLDAALKARMSHLDPDEMERLFGFNGPIGPFSSKIRIANAMGIYSRQIMGKLDLIREMRNAAAHSRGPLSFTSEPIYNAVVSLVADMRIFIPKKDDPDGIRQAFVLMGMLIMSTVFSGSVETGHERLVEYLKDQPTSPEKPAE